MRTKQWCGVVAASAATLAVALANDVRLVGSTPVISLFASGQ
jgi:hypothetical protein